MTKCGAFWRKVQQFKENDDFEGFRQWCGYKSYEQARKDWNAFDTLLIIAKKVAEPVCEVVRKYKLTEDALEPIVHQRQYVGKNETVPSSVQERAIDVLLPKIESGVKITEEDSRKAVSKVLGKETIDWTKPPKPKPQKIDTGICITCNVCNQQLILIHQNPDGKHHLQAINIVEKPS